MVEFEIGQKVKVFFDNEWQDGIIVEMGWEFADISLIKWGGDIRKIEKKFIEKK